MYRECAGLVTGIGEFVHPPQTSPQPNAPTYTTSDTKEFVSCRLIERLACLASALRRWFEMGRMRPKLLIGNGLRAANWLAGGAFGAVARVVGSDVTTVKSLVPSKFRESRTVCRDARSLDSAV